MQTILGSGGMVGIELAKSLKKYTDEIRLVSRNPQKVNESDLLFPADLTQKENVSKAIEGSEVCYLTVGLPYSTRIWRRDWPVLAKNVIDACAEQGSKLVFFDNVYALGKGSLNDLTEESPIRPSSKKGEVRAEVDRLFLDEIDKGKVQIIIARAPDLLSPFYRSSVIMQTIYKNLKQGKSAQWFCNADVKHSLAYAPDVAKATAILSNTPDSYDQIWNLPMDQNRLTVREWTKLFADELGVPAKLKVMPSKLLAVIGAFVPILGEINDMKYQYQTDFNFNCSKFLSKFDFSPTDNRTAVRETVEALRNE